MKKNCPVCNFRYTEPPKPFWIKDLCHTHLKLWNPVKVMLKTCGEVAQLAVDNDEVCYLAEAFAQELTSSAHRYPQAKFFDPTVLQQDVDKCLRLLLLNSRYLKTTAEGNGVDKGLADHSGMPVPASQRH